MKRILFVLTAGLFLAQASLYSQGLDYSSLVSLWRLNDNVSDSHASNDGTFVGTETYEDGPNAGMRAAVFDGKSYIKTGKAIVFDTPDPYSMTAWIKGPSQDASVAGRMHHGGAYTGFELHVHQDINVWMINTYGPSFIEVHSAGTVMDSTWHHVAYTYDGSGVADGVRIYVDGVDATGATTANSLDGTILAEDSDFDIGTRQDGTAHDFKGSISEVSVWASVLSPDDIATIYDTGIHPTALPLISAFVSDLPTVFGGAPVTLSWDTDPAAKLTIDQGVGDVSARTTNGKGSIQVSPDADTTYTLTATKGASTLTRTVTIHVPLIVKFSSDVASAFGGTPVALSWEADPGASLSIDQGVGDLASSTTAGKGTISVSPEADTVYTLTAKRGARTVTQSVTVQVKPLIATFEASPLKVPRGQSVVFSWTAHPLATLTLNPAPGNVTSQTVGGLGSVLLVPSESGTYTLHATRGADSFDLAIDVEVTDPDPGQPPILSDLISFWPLNGDARDANGANDGTFVPAERYGPGVRPGTESGDFDGNTYIKAGKAIAFDTDTPFTLTAWVKGAVQDSTIAGRMIHGDTYRGWELHVHGDMNVWLLNTYGPSMIEVHSADLMLDNTWHHTAFTYDGSSTAAGVHVYLDGVESTGGQTDRLDGSFLSPDAEFNIGTRQNGTAHNFHGNIAEVSVWKAALTPENIASIYLNGVPVAARPKFTKIGTTGNGIKIEWTGSGVLQSAPTVTGPWNNVAGASTPFSETRTGTAKFYRIGP